MSLNAQCNAQVIAQVLGVSETFHHHIDAEKIRRWMLDHQLILFHLPPYSPELNPIEILWKQAKYHWRKFTTWTKSDLFREANEILHGYGDEFEISYA